MAKDKKGNYRTVKKSYLCWFLNNKNKKLSSDRLRRVTECETRQSHETRDFEIEEVEELDRIYIVDFCVFKREDKDSYLIELISGFGFMAKKKWTEIAYAKRYAEINHTYKKKLGVFARWFTVKESDRSLVLHPIKVQSYIDIAQYYSTIPAPAKVNGKFILSENVYSYVLELLKPKSS